jgi:hypothetical protein
MYQKIFGWKTVLKSIVSWKLFPQQRLYTKWHYLRVIKCFITPMHYSYMDVNEMIDLIDLAQ